jgi:hypothetical protein
VISHVGLASIEITLLSYSNLKLFKGYAKAAVKSGKPLSTNGYRLANTVMMGMEREGMLPESNLD